MDKYIITGIPLIIHVILILITFVNRKRILNSTLLLITSIILMISMSIWNYARFIEPQMILVNTTNINIGFDTRFAVISDIHIGEYKGSKYLNRVVDRINNLDSIDFVVIAGDITYYEDDALISKDRLYSDLLPLSRINKSVYAVLGNHDSEQPGPKLDEQLKTALYELGVKVLHNEYVILQDSELVIAGAGDLWAESTDVEFLNNLKKEQNIILINHNPDAVIDKNIKIADLVVSGHTHGGQIRIPLIYKSQIPSKYEFDEGLYYFSSNNSISRNNSGYPDLLSPVFVSAGIGESGLPMRLFIPPRIDILETK